MATKKSIKDLSAFFMAGAIAVGATSISNAEEKSESSLSNIHKEASSFLSTNEKAVWGAEKYQNWLNENQKRFEGIDEDMLLVIVNPDKIGIENEDPVSQMDVFEKSKYRRTTSWLGGHFFNGQDALIQGDLEIVYSKPDYPIASTLLIDPGHAPDTVSNKICITRPFSRYMDMDEVTNLFGNVPQDVEGLKQDGSGITDEDKSFHDMIMHHEIAHCFDHNMYRLSKWQDDMNYAESKDRPLPHMQHYFPDIDVKAIDNKEMGVGYATYLSELNSDITASLFAAKQGDTDILSRMQKFRELRTNNIQPQSPKSAFDAAINIEKYNTVPGILAVQRMVKTNDVKAFASYFESGTGRKIKPEEADTVSDLLNKSTDKDILMTGWAVTKQVSNSAERYVDNVENLFNKLKPNYKIKQFER